MRPSAPSFRLLLLFLLLLCLLACPSPAQAEGPGAHDPVGAWPLRPQPEVVAGFDPPDVTWGAGHRGVDLAGSPGQPVLAALPGQVVFAGRIAGRGVVVVGHGDTRTTYEPVTARVAVGSPVAAGAVLGQLELVGSHCFPRACLHWGWIRGETYLDPLRLVGAGPVRLLPLWGELPALFRPWGVPAGRPGVGGPW
ncbi:MULTISPECIES: M23 family metallopeptidase [unclassified Nocardioides]|uniref:M23 family metallopeptidase n=1 Tax=unclassified Nocardioides TaxID=2615069 RepID=UPI0009EC144C|nr:MULTISPECIES: peptidoglycan DD-metalloendopeptidase family protein [unclassified Nocardioides]